MTRWWHRAVPVAVVFVVPMFGVPAWAAPAPPPMPSMVSALDAGQACTAASTAATSLTPWPLAVLRLNTAWQLSRGGGVPVGVVDTGVDAAPPQLAGAVTATLNVVPGGPTGDCVGHGTFLAGLVAARQTGGAGFAGIAPQASILAVRATDATGATTPDRLGDGIVAAVNAGARVVLVGLGLPQGSAGLQAAVGYAATHQALVVAPAQAERSAIAGNPQPGPVYPAAYAGVLAVEDIGPDGAVPTDAVPGSGPALAAPGDAVMSVGPGGAGYFIGSGAGEAAAMVAGTAALVLAYRPGLSPAQVASRLQDTAYHPGTHLPDPQTGYGIVDPTSALATLLPQESGAGAVTAQAPPKLIPPVAQPAFDPGPSLGVVYVVIALAVLAAAAAAILPLGRRRRWRPATGESASAAGPPVEFPTVSSLPPA